MVRKEGQLLRLEAASLAAEGGASVGGGKRERNAGRSKSVCRRCMSMCRHMHFQASQGAPHDCERHAIHEALDVAVATTIALKQEVSYVEQTNLRGRFPDGSARIAQ